MLQHGGGGRLKGCLAFSLAAAFFLLAADHSSKKTAIFLSFFLLLSFSFKRALGLLVCFSVKSWQNGAIGWFFVRRHAARLGYFLLHTLYCTFFHCALSETFCLLRATDL
jgi:hypothetical protein